MSLRANFIIKKRRVFKNPRFLRILGDTADAEGVDYGSLG
jgi:hypothetical protein